MIDTLTLKEKFENNGFSASQARTLSHAMDDLSKDKLHQVRNELKNDIKEVKSEIRDLRAQMINFWNCMKELRKEMTKDMEQLESRLLHKLTYTTVISQISIGTILVTLMIYFHQNP
jgi:predicted  nucleic acid-binding Zn-ribbon protein